MNLRGSKLGVQEELLRERVGWKLCNYGAHISNYQKMTKYMQRKNISERKEMESWN